MEPHRSPSFPFGPKRRLLVAAMAVIAQAATTTPSQAAAKTTRPVKLWATCRGEGQRSGNAPSQLVCQRNAARKLVWARAAQTTGSAQPPASLTAATAKYSSRPSARNAAAAIGLLNAQGAAGFAYIGPFFVGGASHELFVKVDSSTTYQYDAVEKTPEASSVSGLMALLGAKGKEGFLYKGPALFADDFAKTYLLFVRSSAKKTTYSYRAGTSPTDETAMEKELNSNGAEGFSYLGDLIPDPLKLNVGVRLFAKDDKRTGTSSYSFKSQISDRNEFLAEVTAMGQERAEWRGGYVFGAGTPDMRTRSLYEKSSSTKRAVTYSFTAPATTSIDQLVAAANESANKGELLWGQYQVGTEIVSVYVNGPLTSLPLVGVVVP